MSGESFESNLGREKNLRAFVGDSLKEKHRKSGTPVLTTPVEENHPDPFPIPQNASWAQKRKTNKGGHNKQNRHLTILIRKPEIANFGDPYHRNSTVQVSENDMV